jgi:hypothetical protein
MGYFQKDHIELAAPDEGWASVPPGTQKSTYEDPRVPEGGTLCGDCPARDADGGSHEPLHYQSSIYRNSMTV